MEEMRADVFVRRLIERVGLRRHRLFAATPGDGRAAGQPLAPGRDRGRLVAAASPAARSATSPAISTAVADAGEVGREDADPPEPGAVMLAEPQQVKGLEFDHVYLFGLQSDAMRLAPWEDRWVPEELLDEALPAAGDELLAARRLRLAYVAMTRAISGLVLSWPERSEGRPAAPSPIYERSRAALDADEEIHDEEVFGPAEGLHSTYRMIRDEVLEASWRAGSALSEMRLDTAEDVNEAVARYLELIKLAALIQRPGQRGGRGGARRDQRAARAASRRPSSAPRSRPRALDDYVTGEERERGAAPRARSPPGASPRWSSSSRAAATAWPLGLRHRPLPDLPAQVQVRARLRDPPGADDQPALRDPHPPGARALPRRGAPSGAGEQRADRRRPRAGGLDRLLSCSRAAGGARGSAPPTTSCSTATARSRRSPATTSATCASDSEPVWLERSFAFSIGPHQLRGRVDRVDQLPDGGYELIDYKTGEPKPTRSSPTTSSSPSTGSAPARPGSSRPPPGSYWYVLADERVDVAAEPDDAERVERTVLEVAAGIEARTSSRARRYEICSWCDYRLICPASEA